MLVIMAKLHLTGSRAECIIKLPIAFYKSRTIKTFPLWKMLAEGPYAECHSVECRYAECHSAIKTNELY
jgi:hypothetical protein